MIALDLRVARVASRARRAGIDPATEAQLVDALASGSPSPQLGARLDALAPEERVAVLALAFGGAGGEVDLAERASLALACRDDATRDALLERLDPSLACWPAAVRWLREQGAAADALLAPLAERSLLWVTLEGAASPLGIAARALIAEDVPGAVTRLAAREAGGVVAVGRAVRAMLAAPRADDALVSAVVGALPDGLRGAVADPLLSLGGERFVDLVRAVALGAAGVSRADREAATEALLRHAPRRTGDLVDLVLDDAGAPSTLCAEVLRVHGPDDPPRFAAAASELVRRDPGAWALPLAERWPPETARPLWRALLRTADPILASRAAEALLADHGEERGALAAALLREPGVVPRDLVVRACASLREEELGPLVALLDERSSEHRLLAVRALASAPTGAADALARRYGEERAPRVRAAIVEALGYAPRGEPGEARDPLRAAVIARAEASRLTGGRRPPRWLERCAAALRWLDGSDAPAALAWHLVRLQSLRGSAEPDPEVVEIARMLDPDSREAWVEAALDAWIAADAPAKEHGVLHLAALMGGALAVRSLREAIPAWHRGAHRSMASLATQLLVMRADDPSLCALDVLATAHAHEGYGATARQGIDDAALARGLSPEVLLDRAAPTFDCAPDGARFELGQHVVCVQIDGPRVRLSDGEGIALGGPPRPSRRDDPARVGALRRALRRLHLELPEAIERARERLIDAMASQREWAPGDLEHGFAHPVSGPLYEGLWWRRDGELLPGREVLRARAGGSARLAHPVVDGGRDDLAAAPFAQMTRAVAPLPPSAREALRWEGLRGGVIVARGERHARALAPWSAHGWTPGTVEGGLCHVFRAGFSCARVDASLEVDGIALWSERERRTRVGSLRFSRWGDDRALALGELPEALFSEAVTRATAMLARDQG